MSRRTLFRFAVVIGGWLLAWGVASWAEAYRIAHTQGPDAQASAGMYAFGDFVLFVGVFVVLSLPPTALALGWMRRSERAWAVLTWIALAVAATGALAAVLCAVTRAGRVGGAPLQVAIDLLFLRVLAAPLLLLVQAVIAWLAPAGPARRRARWALACEGFGLAYLVLHLAIAPRI